MTRRRPLLLIAVVLVALGLWWLLRSPQADAKLEGAKKPGPEASPLSTAVSPAPKSSKERRKEAVDAVLSMLGAPISFYGKVVDQDGDPVPDASVGYSALDKFMAPGTGYTGKSDASGLFSISGIKGARLSINVRKEGYYFIDGKSNAAFSYGGGSDGYFAEPPTKDNPAIFVLHKMGTTESLVRAEQSARIPKDGTPVTVNLMTGRLSPNGNLRVEARTEAPVGGRRFTWRCRVTVPGGGLADRTGQFEFEAPEDGYQESVEFGMRHDAEQWTSDQQRDYFVKLPDGRFARINFRMIAGGNHYFVMESFLNPKPGSRNLEYDPKQASGIQ